MLDFAIIHFYKRLYVNNLILKQNVIITVRFLIDE